MRPCRQHDEQLVAYLAGTGDARQHVTTLWCTRCGALGRRQGDQVEATWTLPQGARDTRAERRRGRR